MELTVHGAAVDSVSVRALVDDGPHQNARHPHTTYALHDFRHTTHKHLCQPLSLSLTNPPSNNLPNALLVERGNCSFAQKAAHAADAGAALLLVADALLYAPAPHHASVAEMRLTDPCAVNCALGSAVLNASSISPANVRDGLRGLCGASCPSQTCGLATPSAGISTDGGATRQACCALTTLSTFTLSNASSEAPPAPPLVPTFVLPLESVRRLDDFAQGQPPASGGMRVQLHAPVGKHAVTPSLVGILLLGTLVAGGASRYAARFHDRRVAEAAAGSRAGLAPKADDEVVQMSAPAAFGFLGFVSAALVGLYLLLQAGVRAILLVLVGGFALVSTQALAALLAPAVSARLPPQLRGRALALAPSCCCEPLPLPSLLALAPAAAASLVWLAGRHADWAWVLQDALAGCVCSLFLRTVEVPSLRVAAVLLSLMFCYDVFMVFISPLIFHHSVMMSVATAGAPSEAAAADGTCDRFEGERMPTLFLVPRPGGLPGAPLDYMMLGLGDVVLPGLLLTLAARLDRAAAGGANAFSRLSAAAAADDGSDGSDAHEKAGGARARGPLSYWALATAGYAVGLSLALLANVLGWTINNVEGQPALLYLVPCSLAPVCARACLRGELRSVWSGSLLHPEAGLDAGPKSPPQVQVP